MISKQFALFAPASALVLAGVLAACGGGGGGGGTGTLRLALTDAPCGYDQVWVTIEKVRVHRSATADDSDAGWAEVVLNPARRVDLLSLTNGVLEELGQTPLPAGKYTQMRLVLAANGGATPLANSVVPTGSAETPLNTPSGQQSGLKMNVNIDVAADQLADVLLDFQVCKSVVRAGNSGNYQLKPVIAVTPRWVSGVQGYVAGAVANGNTLVSLQQQQNGAPVIVRATTPDPTGKALLPWVAPGSYDLVVTAPGYATNVVTGVAVVADTVTTVNSAAAPMPAASSPSAAASGVVATTTVPIDASLVARQAITSSGRSIEVAGGPVDASTGGYALTLPVAAPQVAPYVAAPAALAFAADTAAAGKYTLVAESVGSTKNAGPLTFGAGASMSTNFTFP
jgi:hypothetical protein